MPVSAENGRPLAGTAKILVSLRSKFGRSLGYLVTVIRFRLAYSRKLSIHPGAKQEPSLQDGRPQFTVDSGDQPDPSTTLWILVS